MLDEVEVLGMESIYCKKNNKGIVEINININMIMGL